MIDNNCTAEYPCQAWSSGFMNSVNHSEQYVPTIMEKLLSWRPWTDLFVLHFVPPP